MESWLVGRGRYGHCYEEEEDKSKRWSRFSEFVNTASFLCEFKLEEQRRLLADNETSECRLSEEEEEEKSRRRIFSDFPKKLRSSLKEPNLMEFNQNPTVSESTQNALQWLPSDSKMEALRNPSSDDESFSLPSLVEHNSSYTIDDKSVTTKMEDPINPNLQSCLSSYLIVNTVDVNASSNTSRKRRAVNQVKRASRVKKPKVDLSEQVVRERPEWLVQMMENMEGEVTDAKLIIEKSLFVTDVNPTQSRLSMPNNKVIKKDFLTEAEMRIIEQDIGEKKKTGVKAFLMNQWSKRYDVTLKRWEMKKEEENGCWNYSLVGGWNAFVRENGLKAADNVTVWSFRSSGLLYFALEKTT